MIYCTRKLKRQFIGKHNTVSIRSLKKYDKDSLQSVLLSTDWSPVIHSDDVSVAWNNFKAIFLNVIDSLAPVKQIRTKQRTEPWITAEVLSSIRERNRAFYNFRNHKTDDNFESFKTLRNKTQTLIQKAKSDYFTGVLEDNRYDSKSLWSYLKSLGMPSKKNKSSSTVGLNIDGELCFIKSKVAEKFNNFYVTVASNLVSKLPCPSFKYGKQFISRFYSTKGVVNNNYSFSIVSESKVYKYLNKLSTNKATGLDGIPARFIVDSASLIAKPIAHIINLSLIQGSVPDDLKSARVVPLYKKNDKTEVGNYRPVSILSVISKVFERVVYDQIETYLKDKQLLYDLQSGFRTGFSTDTCLIHLSDYIRFEMDKGHIVGMVLLDLQKAFDTVDHSILMYKLKSLGLGQDIIRWFYSYLSNRQQLVDISGTRSSSRKVTCGVPQGSILGPLLFLIYVNDMSAVVKNKLLLYADDSAILVSHKDRVVVEKLLSEDLHSVSEWLIDNKLSLHLGKTESIVFCSKPKQKSNPTLNVSCKGTNIQSTSSVKYLGVTLDQTLSCEEIAMNVIKKANSRIKFLYRKRQFLTKYTKRLLAFSLIQCHFDYACSFWYHALAKQMKAKLQVTQNKLIRFVLNLDCRTRIEPEHFKILQWLPVDKRVDQISLGHVFKINNGLSPKYMSDHFIPQSSLHNYSTRFSAEGGLAIPKVGSFGKKTFSYVGCSLWNRLPAKCKDFSSISSFKACIKEHFLSSM
jgi:hypothetical protein